MTGWCFAVRLTVSRGGRLARKAAAHPALSIQIANSLDWLDLNAGAQGRDRTTDTVIFSHVLYQLSYLGISQWPDGRLERVRALTLVIGAVQ